jgi:hypothetical protein
MPVHQDHSSNKMNADLTPTNLILQAGGLPEMPPHATIRLLTTGDISCIGSHVAPWQAFLPALVF